MFSSSVVSDLKTSLLHILTSVTSTMNEGLTREVSAAEIKIVVFAIHPERTPGPDGMTAVFYQKFWHIIGPQKVSII